MTRPEGASTRATDAPAVGADPTWPLTARIRRGDEGAFAAFYEHWFDRAFAMAKSITRRDEAFCLDVVQDSMMRVVKSIPALDEERSVSAWMGRTLFTTAIDRLRQEARREARERSVAEVASDEATEREASANHEDERFDWIRRRLAELPVKDRELVLARFGDGETLESIGARHGLTGNAAHGRIYRVIDRLKHAAKELFGD